MFHERYAFCACRDARAEWRYRSKTYGLGDGDSMLLEPGETHCTTVVRKVANFKVMLIPPGLFHDAARDFGVEVTTHFRFAHAEDPQLYRAIYEFGKSIEAADTLLEQQSRFVACVRLLLQYAERAPRPVSDAPTPSAIERVRAYLHESYDQSVTLGELAAVAGVSRFHLVRCFTRRVGLSPHAYQINVRVARGRALLVAGMPAAQVATRVGFADQSHFSRHFKRIWRTTPADYARAALR